MKTVQECLIELDTTELVDEYFYEHPVDYDYLEEPIKQLSVYDIQERSRKHLRDYIEYLRAIQVKNDEDGRKGLLFVFRMLHGFSDIDLVHELVYIDELMRDGTKAEGYSYILTDPAEVMGFYVADTPLTQHSIVYLIVNVLFEASFFGWTSEDVKRERDLTFAEDSDTEDDSVDGIDLEYIHNYKQSPVELESPEEKRLHERADEAENAYFEESRRNELQQIINLLFIEEG